MQTKLPKLLARMRCHLAYARSVGFERAAFCPHYLRGVDILPSDDGRAIEVVGDRPAVILEIRHSVDDVAPHAH